MKPFLLTPLALALLFASCANKPTANDAIMAAAQPKPTAKVEIRTIRVSSQEAERQLKEVTGIAKEAVIAAEEASAANAIHIKTIEELSAKVRLLSDDTEVAKMLTQLQKEADAHAKLDYDREVRSNKINDLLKETNRELLKVTNALVDAEADAEKQHLELTKYRELYSVTIQAVGDSNEFASKEKKRADENQHYADTRFSSILWTVGITFAVTCLLWVGGIVYAKSQSFGLL